MKDNMRTRQVHLDFHTSEVIEGIGKDFSKGQFQEMLKKGHVNSITIFSKCHHGWSYHPTKVGKTHPHLKFDLLQAQMDACKEIDVKVPVYLTAGVDNLIAEAHPEWREIDKDGKITGWTSSPLDPGFKTICFNSPSSSGWKTMISSIRFKNSGRKDFFMFSKTVSFIFS